MKPIYVYAGSFCPPTYGHWHIVCQTAKIFPEVIIVCSVNPNKNGQWFTPEECKDLWQTYDLLANVKVETLASLSKRLNDFSGLILIRGIRNEEDLQENVSVIKLNSEQFGINKFFYQLADKKYCQISSTKAREAAMRGDITELNRMVNNDVYLALMEKVKVRG